MTDAVLSTSAAATEAVGAELAGQLAAGDLVVLEGDLGAGKTTLVRGLVAALGGDPLEVSSPTFVLLQSYPVSHPALNTVHHVDLYRLADSVRDLREVGLEEVLSEPAAVTCVEWPRSGIAGWIPAASRVWRVTLTAESAERRRIRVSRDD